MVRFAVPALRAFLAILFAILVMMQTLSMPGQFAHMAQESPEFAPYRWPLTILTILGIACVQVVLVCTWHLLTLVQRDAIFSAPSLRWVDVIIGAVAAADLLLLGLFVWLAPTFDDPGAPMMLILIGTGVTVVGLLVLVLRTLLRQATDLRADMDEVI